MAAETGHQRFTGLQDAVLPFLLARVEGRKRGNTFDHVAEDAEGYGHATSVSTFVSLCKVILTF